MLENMINDGEKELVENLIFFFGFFGFFESFNL